MKLKQNNKGSALMECVISLVIIALISVSAVTTIDYTRADTTKTEAKRQATLMAENAVECFYGATNYEELFDDIGLEYNESKKNYACTLSEEYGISVEVSVDKNEDSGESIKVTVNGIGDGMGGTYKK